MRLFAVSLLLALSFVACEGNEPDVMYPVMQLRARAGSDFECPPQQIKTRTLDDRTKVAEGCGQKATYIYVCNTCEDTGASLLLNRTVIEECNCTWSLNSVARPR